MQFKDKKSANEAHIEYIAKDEPALPIPDVTGTVDIQMLVNCIPNHITL